MISGLGLLEKKLGYAFCDETLVEAALTHSSFAKENGGQVEYNERLEFLGDAFFNAIVGEEFFHLFPDRKEGFLSRQRAAIVCENSLAQKARQIGLGEHLRLSRGEEKTGGSEKNSILADAMEAIIGAIYLDSDYEKTKKIVLKLFRSELDKAAQGDLPDRDYKTKLQESLHAKGKRDIEYRLLDESGPDHDKTFTIGLYVDGRPESEGKGKSKKEAERNAAKHILEREN